LLSLRMLIIALLAIALARPALSKGGWRGLAGRSRVTAVILLDCSPSMTVEEAGRTRLDAARDIVLQILASLHPGDQVSLLVTGDSRRQAELPTTNFQEIAARVADAKPTASTADFPEALVDALSLFDHTESTDRQLYIVCDRQATSWSKLTGPFAASWQDRLRRARWPLRAYVLPVGNDNADNLAVDSLRIVDPPVIAGCPAELLVTLRNYGSRAATDVPLTITSGDRVIAQSTTVPSRGVQTLRVPTTFPSGSQVVQAAVKAGGLSVDDQL